MNTEDRKLYYQLALDPDTLNNLSPYTLNNLSPYTLKNLSPYTLNKLKDYEELVKAIPVLEKPYTKLLKDIQAKQRIFKQSTYGEIEDYDPKANVCGTPMCTAGHLVNMAGKPGYDLKNKYGWAIAATVIHKKAHPDLPAQNFGSIPQEWALAYIEEMAEIESNK